MQLPWKELKSLRAKNNDLFFVTEKGEEFPVKPDQLKEAFKTWHHHAPGNSKKAAFDYFNEEKFVLKLNLFLTIFLAGGISAIFLSDGFQTLHCNFLLEKTEMTKTANAEITKIKKNRRGNIVWDLNFKTENGQELSGRRQAVNPEAAVHNPGKKDSSATVIYSTEEPKCFDVSTRLNEKVLPKAQRWFTTEFTLGFGAFFALVTIFLCPWLITRIRKKHPHKEIVEKIYAEL